MSTTTDGSKSGGTGRVVWWLLLATLMPWTDGWAQCPPPGQTIGRSPTSCAIDLDENTFKILNFGEQNLGRQLMDIEVRRKSGELSFSGVWFPVEGEVRTAFDLSESEWFFFTREVADLPGRWLDMEVLAVDDQLRFYGLFLEGGERYEQSVRYGMAEANLQLALRDTYETGLQIVDFEAYELDGDTFFAGIWQNGPRQPRTVLYHHLRREEIQDLLTPQYPYDPEKAKPRQEIYGRPIDVEIYRSSLHKDVRNALILAMVPGHEWAVQGGKSEEDFEDLLREHSDENTFLIDLEVDDLGNDGPFSGVWGDTYKSLHEVTPISEVGARLPLSEQARSVIESFETGDVIEDDLVGVYARNLRTGQYVGHREAQPFYLASASKLAVHFRLWKRLEEAAALPAEDRVDLNDLVLFTRNPFWVDSRRPPGLDSDDLGQLIPVRQLDEAMMQRSDNAATSILVETILGRDVLNNWLAGLDGIGRGFGPVTGISDLDRVILWQGQVERGDKQPDPSYFLIPSWRFEPWFRGEGTADLQDLADEIFDGVIPRWDRPRGYTRYFRMGLNSAEPRALGALLAAFEKGKLLKNVGGARSVLTQGSAASCRRPSNKPIASALPCWIFLGAPGLAPIPADPPRVFSKDGFKGFGARPPVLGNLARTHAAIFTKGPETIVMTVLARNVDTGADSRLEVDRMLAPALGYYLFRQLIPDLQDGGAQHHEISDTVIGRGEPWTITHRVLNGTLQEPGGDALPYKIRFYASTDTTISRSDHVLGTFQTPTVHPGGELARVVQEFAGIPASVPDGTYFVGWILDVDAEVGEWDDRDDSNAVLMRRPDGTPVQITVDPDCNDNDVADAFDIGFGFSTDLNSNGVPDECEQRSVAWLFSGTAAGGQIDLTVDGFGGTCMVSVPTTAGESAATVAANVAAAINGDPCFTGQGIGAFAEGGHLVIQGLELGPDDVSESITDPGLQHEIGPLSVPGLSRLGQLLLVGLLLGIGTVVVRRSSG